jgi:hypothetical protein
VNETWLDPLPSFLPPFVFAGLAACLAILSCTRAKGGWFAPLVAVYSAILAAEFVVLSYFDLPTWRAEVLIARIMELPAIAGISGVCLAQAGRLGCSRRGAAPFGEAATREWLRKVLAAGPAVLLGAWLLALVAEMIWPAPVLEPFAPAPPRDFFIILFLAMPTFFYLALLGWLFAKAGGPRVPTARLRLKNLSFSIGTFAYLLLNTNVVAQIAVAAFLPDGPRRAVTSAQIALQDRLMIVVTLAVAFGLALTAAPAVNEVLLRTTYPTLMRVRDRFEARRWQIVAAGRVKRLRYATHYATEAASLMGIPEGELTKALTAIELVAILANPPEDAPEITPDKARHLLALQHEILREKSLAHLLGWSKALHGDLSEDREVLSSDSFNDALEAALLLAEAPHDHNGVAEHLRHAFWFHLAAVAAAGAGILPHDLPRGSDRYNLTRRRALRAYLAARRTAATPISRG